MSPHDTFASLGPHWKSATFTAYWILGTPKKRMKLGDSEAGNLPLLPFVTWSALSVYAVYSHVGLATLQWSAGVLSRMFSIAYEQASATRAQP